MFSLSGKLSAFRDLKPNLLEQLKQFGDIGAKIMAPTLLGAVIGCGTQAVHASRGGSDSPHRQ